MAAGTCVARVLGAEMTGDPAMLASGCEEDIEVMPRRDRGLINQLVMGHMCVPSQFQTREIDLFFIFNKTNQIVIQMFLHSDHFFGCKYSLISNSGHMQES